MAQKGGFPSFCFRLFLMTLGFLTCTYYQAFHSCLATVFRYSNHQDPQTPNEHFQSSSSCTRRRQSCIWNSRPQRDSRYPTLVSILMRRFLRGVWLPKTDVPSFFSVSLYGKRPIHRCSVWYLLTFPSLILHHYQQLIAFNVNKNPVFVFYS